MEHHRRASKTEGRKRGHHRNHHPRSESRPHHRANHVPETIEKPKDSRGGRPDDNFALPALSGDNDYVRQWLAKSDKKSHISMAESKEYQEKTGKC